MIWTANAVPGHDPSRCSFVLVATKKEPADAPIVGTRFTVAGGEEVVPNLRNIVEGHCPGVVDGGRRDLLCGNDVAPSPPEPGPDQEQKEDENRDAAEERWHTSRPDVVPVSKDQGNAEKRDGQNEQGSQKRRVSGERDREKDYDQSEQSPDRLQDLFAMHQPVAEVVPEQHREAETEDTNRDEVCENRGLSRFTRPHPEIDEVVDDRLNRLRYV